jgi:hypothetical protein
MPSLAPIVTTASVSGSNVWPYLRAYQSQMAPRTSGMPREGM